MSYTVKQLADLAGVTRRTLHYYHQIGLLTPGEIAATASRTCSPCSRSCITGSSA